VFVGFGDGGHQIELVHYIDPPSPSGYLDKHQFGATHVCFNVGDLARLHRELSVKGIRFVTEPRFRETPNGRIGSFVRGHNALGALDARDTHWG
jgi:hypothetical protein